MYAPFNKSLIEFVLNWTEYYYITSSDCNSYEVQCCRRDLYVKEKQPPHDSHSWESIKCHYCYSQSLYRCLSISTPSDEIIISIKGSYGLISSHPKSLHSCLNHSLFLKGGIQIFGESLELLMVGCEDFHDIRICLPICNKLGSLCTFI